MLSMTWIFIVHTASTLFMCGLCWFVQLVHYPLFLSIREEDFSDYEKKNFVTAYLTVPVMTVEMLTGLYLVYQNQEPLYLINTGLLIVIALSTAFLQVPYHLKLMQVADRTLIKKLIRTNWIRTLSWTIRMVILCVLLDQYMK